MFHVPVTSSAIDYARNLLRRHNFGRRGTFDGDRHQQETGLIGEVVVQDLFNQPRAIGGKTPDGGADLVLHGYTIDVKTMGRSQLPREDWVNNYPKVQAHYPNRIILFCSLCLPRRTLTVCGWLFKDQLFHLGEFHPEGTVRRRGDGTEFPLRTDQWEIRTSELFQCFGPAELEDAWVTFARAECRCACVRCQSEVAPLQPACAPIRETGVPPKPLPYVPARRETASAPGSA